jgi:hypothetical protein
MEVTWWMVGDRNKWELGSSTSQSIHWIVPLGSERAELTATVVFPVPLCRLQLKGSWPYP